MFLCRGDELILLDREGVMCVQLSLVSEVLKDQEEIEKTPDAPHVRCLWTLSKGKRILLWKELQPQLQLQELGLGGEWYGTKCPVDDEELAILFPKDSLHELQQLYLHAACRVTDSGLSSLASAGCGAQVTSLTLRGE